MLQTVNIPPDLKMDHLPYTPHRSMNVGEATTITFSYSMIAFAVYTRTCIVLPFVSLLPHCVHSSHIHPMFIHSPISALLSSSLSKRRHDSNMVLWFWFYVTYYENGKL